MRDCAKLLYEPIAQRKTSLKCFKIRDTETAWRSFITAVTSIAT